MKDILEMLESATAGGRNLDALIEVEHRRFEAYAVGLNDKQRAHWKPVGAKGEVEEGVTRYHPPMYSFNIDDALRLLPDGWEAILYTGNGTAELYDPKLRPRKGIRERAKAATVALAICAAALRARAAVTSGDRDLG